MQRALKQAIAERQAQALARRRALGEQLSRAGCALHRKASRPEALALAAGAGFLLGRRKWHRPPASGESAEPREPKPGPSALALASAWVLRQLGPALISLWLEPRQPAATATPEPTTSGPQPPSA